MTAPKYLRKKTAKGRTYYYFDTGLTNEVGRPILTPLPSPKAPDFGDKYARAKAARTQRKDRRGILTFDGLFRLFERSPEWRALSPSSQQSYDRYIRAASNLMRDRHGNSPPAKGIERKDVIAVREALSDTPGAANQMIRAVGALYAWAVQNEKVKDNPARLIKRFKAKEHPPWPDELLEEALADPQIGMAVALFYFTGQRINEVARMSWSAIEGDYMRVSVQKTRKDIRVAMLPELVDRLRAQPKDSVSILVNANGQPWTIAGLRQKLQAWAKERGHHVVPHGLRKNAVNSLLEAGCSGAEVSGITDQSIAMVEHYAKGRNKLTLGRAAIIKFDAARKARNKG